MAEPQGQDLLIYLVHMGQPVSKDQIIDALWPKGPRPGKAMPVPHYPLPLEDSAGATAGALCNTALMFIGLRSVATDLERFEGAPQGGSELRGRFGGAKALLEKHWRTITAITLNS